MTPEQIADNLSEVWAAKDGYLFSITREDYAHLLLTAVWALRLKYVAISATNVLKWSDSITTFAVRGSLLVALEDEPHQQQGPQEAQ